MLLLTIIAFCSIAIIFAGLIAWLRNSERPENKWFLIFTIFLGTWALANFIDSNSVLAPRWTELATRVDFVIAPFIGYSFVRFASYIIVSPGPRVRRLLGFISNKTFRVVALSSSVLAALMAALNLVYSTSVSGQDVIIHLKWPLVIYGTLVMMNVIVALLVLLAAHYLSSRSDRRRLSFILLGFAIAAGANALTNLVFPVFFADRDVITLLNGLGYIGIFFVALCIYLAIGTRKLFDVRVAIVRSLAYVLLLTTIAGLYVGVVFLIGYAFLDGQGIQREVLLVSAVVTLFVAATFQYLQYAFDRLTKQLFFRDAYEVQDVLNRLSDVTTNTISVNDLMRDASVLLSQTVKGTFCVFVLAEGKVRREVGIGRLKEVTDQVHEQVWPMLTSRQPVVTEILGSASPAGLLRKHAIEVVIPLYTKDTLLGYMAFGSKQNGVAYQQQDIQLLSLSGTAMSIAIQNALRFEEIEKFSETLQLKVEDATRKLRRSNNKLRQIDATKDDFISMASHQLRTPLTSIKGYVSMVLEGDAGKLTAMQRRLLTQAFISSQRMVYLISDLLNVSRLRTGKFIIESVPTNLAEVTSDEVRQLAETAAGRNLKLIFDKPEKFPDLMLDETKMRQVIMNFIDNAIYYTPSGGSITVALVERPKVVEFTVTDTGIGVPKAEQHHLFTKFFRSPNAKRARPDGTGLGLFMAKKVIVAQGGSVIFRSREGQGSTFGFVFAKAPLKVPEKLEPRKFF